jgi:hypothetical protein
MQETSAPSRELGVAELVNRYTRFLLKLLVTNGSLLTYEMNLSHWNEREQVGLFLLSSQLCFDVDPLVVVHFKATVGSCHKSLSFQGSHTCILYLPLFNSFHLPPAPFFFSRR